MEILSPDLKFRPFMESLAVHKLPPAEGWCFEIKFDGYRCQGIKQRGETHIFSRRGNIFDEKFPAVLEALSRLHAREFILDGEVVALDDHGRCNFNLLQHARRHPERIHFYAFDVLFLDGKDLAKLPFVKRRSILEREFPGSDHFHISPVFDDPDALLAAVRSHGFEGVMAKNKGSRYESGERSGAWQKKKTQPSDDFLIGGYLPGPNGFDELVVGRREGNRLRFMSSVRAGFVPRVKKQVFAAIHRAELRDCPFSNLPEKRGQHKFDEEKMRKAVWVRPRYLAEIAFNAVTPDGHLRHAKFLRLRETMDRPR
jgi:DNA ligase D-like protein (predicted ligase)